ncbi:hypothetical protein HNV12_24225 [Methanococcoides sp. SA1]|nr:hypothetical protein [Methanococcoides sp. SA1]
MSIYGYKSTSSKKGGLSIKNVTIITIFLLLLVFGCFNSTATEITLEPSTQIATTGESFTVDVFVSPGTAIAGLQFDLEFDSSKIQVDSVSEGLLFSQNGALTFFNAGSIDNNAGTLSGVYSLIMGSPGVVGPESAASITMSVKEQATGTSTISLKNVIISDSLGFAIEALVRNTTLTINDASVVPYNPYDENKNYMIDIGEVSAAIDDYRLQGSTSIADVSELIDLYRTGKPYC